jgi:hypothetical protein
MEASREPQGKSGMLLWADKVLLSVVLGLPDRVFLPEEQPWMLLLDGPLPCGLAHPEVAELVAGEEEAGRL